MSKSLKHFIKYDIDYLIKAIKYLKANTKGYIVVNKNLVLLIFRRFAFLM